MKFIKRNLHIVEPTINEEGYYVIGNVAIHPDIFHKQYQPLGFTLTAEEVANLFEVLSTRNNLIDEVLRTTFIDDPYTRGLVDEQKKIIPILNQIKQWQDGNK